VISQEDIAFAKQKLRDGPGIFFVDEEPSLTYSAGISRWYDFPEIIITGADEATAKKDILTIISYLKNGHRLRLDEVLEGILSGPIAFKLVEDREYRRLAAVPYGVYRGKFKLAQCVFPDGNGAFEWTSTTETANNFIHHKQDVVLTKDSLHFLKIAFRRW
jgi:hypothetical protein